jgi:peptide/nickel transport system permease protein
MSRVLWLRLASAAPLLLAVSLVCFLLLHFAPGSFLDRLRLDPELSPSALRALERSYRLDRPWPEQYLAWLGAALRGDLGTSLVYQRPVQDLLLEGGRYTCALIAAAGALSWLAGLALALVAAARPGGSLDRILVALAVAALSVPTLVLAVGALALAAATEVLPLGGGSAGDAELWSWPRQLLDFLHHLALPSLVLTGGLLPLCFLQARGAILEELPSGFVRAARARGLSSAQALVGHALRAARPPLVAVAGGSIARLLNGALLVEVVMGWPGVGRLALQGLSARDPFLLLGVFSFVAILLLAGNLLSDLVLAAVHPQIRMEESRR